MNAEKIANIKSPSMSKLTNRKKEMADRWKQEGTKEAGTVVGIQAWTYHRLSSSLSDYVTH